MSVEDDVRKKLENERNSIENPDISQNLKDSVYEEVLAFSQEKNEDVIYLKMDAEIIKSMKFLSVISKVFGIFTIISGGMACLSIIGAVIGVPIILIGLKLFKVGDYLEQTIIKKDEKNLKLSIITMAKAAKYYLISLLAYFILIFITIIIAFLIILFSGL